MSWRIVVIENKYKLSFKNNNLLIQNEGLQIIHLSEIKLLLINSTQVTITTYLISQLIKYKIDVIFCDECRDPVCELVPYYGSHNTSKRIGLQINWEKDNFPVIWQRIVKEKISNQNIVLNRCKNRDDLRQFIGEVKLNDSTNKEGQAAKLYFIILYGVGFSRKSDNNINACLNYGYKILLSLINRAIVYKGYITQIGIFHKNEFNQFNLSCDLMEPFRPYIDQYVYEHRYEEFDKNYKINILNIFNGKIRIADGLYYVSSAIDIYVDSVIVAIEEGNIAKIKFPIL